MTEGGEEGEKKEGPALSLLVPTDLLSNQKRKRGEKKGEKKEAALIPGFERRSGGSGRRG